MSQAGYTPISLYYSTTAAAAPSSGNLVAGELALNTLDEKLYFKNSAGTVKLLASSAASSATVSSVAQSFTGGLISVGGSPITTSGTLALTVAGTSGGVPYFNSASSWDTSAALAANAIVLGGGAGAAPATTATGTGVVTALGVNTGTAGAFVVNGGALGTPSSGTATNLTGLPLSTGVTGTLALGNGGTGQTTAGAAFNALSPITSTGDLIIGNGVNSATRLGIGTNGYILSSNGTTASWTAPAGGGASISNDTATSTNVYPLFAAATSGTPTTIYTSNPNYLYKPSTGELTSSAMISSNGITVNANTIAADYTIAASNNGLSAGPVSVNTGITVTVSTGSTWTVV